ncbi:MAG: Fe-S cluster domain-containing protein [Desulfarculales bacterium]|jgi:electron transport complex protein RnfB|nr:Fe-S cluster domain-containing protein [Desulfarculales bacterium]
MDSLLNDAFTSTAVFTVFGIVAGMALAYAAMRFKVEVDPKVAAAKEALPGANCGACGFAGCESYAEAVATDPEVPTNKCAPGGPAAAQKLAQITGKAAAEAGDSVAVLCCANPGAAQGPKYAYRGIMSCAAANSAFGGPNPCVYGCLGLGDCSQACPFGAITMRGGQPVIDYGKCIGCNKCVSLCPKKVLTLAPRAAATVIACNNPEKGANVRAMCEKGCISCQLCVRKGPEGVYQATANGIRVDFAKSTDMEAEAVLALREGCRPKVLHLFAEIKETNASLLGHNH